MVGWSMVKEHAEMNIAVSMAKIQTLDPRAKN